MGTCRRHLGVQEFRTVQEARQELGQEMEGQTFCLLARLLGDSDALRVGDAVADLSRDVLALLARHNGATSSGTLLHLPALQEHGETR